MAGYLTYIFIYLFLYLYMKNNILTFSIECLKNICIWHIH